MMVEQRQRAPTAGVEGYEGFTRFPKALYKKAPAHCESEPAGREAYFVVSRASLTKSWESWM
jgi:hypothetical protein